VGPVKPSSKVTTKVSRPRAAEAFLLGIVAMLLWLPVNALIVMLTAGALHADVAAQVPAWSYGQALVVTIALLVVGSFFYRTS
jgi:hypothetical protein